MFYSFWIYIATVLPHLTKTYYEMKKKLQIKGLFFFLIIVLKCMIMYISYIYNEDLVIWQWKQMILSIWMVRDDRQWCCSANVDPSLQMLFITVPSTWPHQGNLHAIEICCVVAFSQAYVYLNMLHAQWQCPQMLLIMSD